MRFLLIFLPVLLTGCSTVVQHIAENKIEEIVEIRAVASAPSPVFSSERPTESVHLDSSAVPAEIAKLEDTGVTTIDPIETQIVRPKAKKLIDKVTDSVMSAAEAATSSKKEIITYNNTGGIESKVVEVNESSILENLTKLVGFLSATLGLYIGFKKLREPVATA